MKLLVTDPLPPRLTGILPRLLPPGVEFTVVPAADEETLFDAIADAEILLSTRAPLTQKVLSQATSLVFIQALGAGTDQVDLAWARAHGIPVSHTPGVNAGAVADWTVMMILALTRHLVEASGAVRRGEWPADEMVARALPTLASLTVGIVGLGAIGRAVAERLVPFGPRLLYHARHEVAAAPGGARRVPLPDLLGAADVVTLHVPLTDDTRGLIDEAAFERMRPGIFLVNAARGGVVDEVALRHALTSGRLQGAALDVLANEAPGGNPFGDLANVIVTPHMAGATADSVQAMLAIVLENIRRVQAGEEPRHRVA